MTDEQKADLAVRDLIQAALKWADWSAGEGIGAIDSEDVTSPEDFLVAYSVATGDEDWATLHTRLSARLADAGKPAAGEGGLAKAVAEAAWMLRKNGAIEFADQLEAALSTSVPAGVVGIKPLEWVGIEKNGTVEYWSARTGLHQNGEYEVYKIGEGVFRADYDGSPVESGLSSPITAKAAAQADHDTRIRACLTTPPAQEPTR